MPTNKTPKTTTLPGYPDKTPPAQPNAPKGTTASAATGTATKVPPKAKTKTKTATPANKSATVPKGKKSPQVAKYVSDWLLNVKNKNIINPEDTDLEKFLLTKGFDADAVKNAIRDLPDKKVSDIENDAQMPDSTEIEDSNKIQVLDAVKNTINKLNNRQLEILRKELMK